METLAFTRRCLKVGRDQSIQRYHPRLRIDLEAKLGNVVAAFDCRLVPGVAYILIARSALGARHEIAPGHKTSCFGRN